MKKAIVIALVFALLISILPALRLQAFADTATGSCGSNLSWTLDTETCTLTISGTGPMDDWEYGCAPWYSSRRSINTVVMKDGVTTVGSCAFSGCDKVTAVTLPGSLTRIGESAFAVCSGLTTLRIPDQVTDIGWNAFRSCSSLQNIILPSGLKEIQPDTFNGCTALAEIVLPEGVESIGEYAFADCISLQSICLPESLTTIKSRAFWDCSGLSGITIPAAVSAIEGGAFAYCSAITAFSVAQTSPYFCSDSQGILYDKEITRLIACPGMFSGVCTVPGTVTVIDTEAFEYCTGLTKVVIPYGVREIRASAFYDCTGLKEAAIPNSVTLLGDSVFAASGLTSVHIPSSVPEIPNYAFQGCQSLTEAVIGNNVTRIGEGSFINCENLEKVNLGIRVARIESNSFTNCAALRKIRLPEGLTFLGFAAFMKCSSLEEATVPESVETVEDLVFYDCSSMKKLTVFSKTCTIGQDVVDRKNTVIYGYSGSTAQAYASANSVSFVPLATEVNPFTDVKKSNWFYAPVLWAITHEPPVTAGVDATHFMPGKVCTREQVMTFLWAAMGKPAAAGTDNPFADVKESDWFYEPVLWAVENGITSGVDATHFGVGKPCTRAQVVQFLWALNGRPAPESTDNPFLDVKSSNWFSSAVLWAVENKITSGLDPTHFGPNNTCTRAQVMTFLWAAMGNQ